MFLQLADSVHPSEEITMSRNKEHTINFSEWFHSPLVCSAEELNGTCRQILCSGCSLDRWLRMLSHWSGRSIWHHSIIYHLGAKFSSWKVQCLQASPAPPCHHVHPRVVFVHSKKKAASLLTCTRFRGCNCTGGVPGSRRMVSYSCTHSPARRGEPGTYLQHLFQFFNVVGEALFQIALFYHMFKWTY